MIKRSELLGIITCSKQLIAVAGTHGKTSVSSILANIMSQPPYQCNAILGGISKNFNSNLVFASGSETYITEADEFDRSFLQLHPYIAVVTSTDADHLDIYGDHENLINAFAAFAHNIQKGGKLIVRKGVGLNPKVDNTVGVYSYSIHEEADFQAYDIRIDEHTSRFRIRSRFMQTEDFILGIPGIMNVENALAAVAAAVIAGVDEASVSAGLRSYKGVRRRFDQRIICENFVYIDDYAHHPKEIEACINSVKSIYPGRKITGVFQPHLFTRTRDFAKEFAKSLESLDQIILLDIYPARELPVYGITSMMLLGLINHADKHLCTKENLIPFLLNHQPQVLLTLGAGDIDRLVEPIENTFKSIIS